MIYKKTPNVILYVHISEDTLDHYNPNDNGVPYYGKEVGLILDDNALLTMEEHESEAQFLAIKA